MLFHQDSKIETRYKSMTSVLTVIVGFFSPCIIINVPKHQIGIVEFSKIYKYIEVTPERKILS